MKWKGTDRRREGVILAPWILLTAFLLVPATLGRGYAQEKHAQEKKGREQTVPTVSNLQESDWKKVLARHQGSVLIVNFWATWCEPCREEFGHLNRLSRKYKNKGMAVVTVSLDPQEERGEVLAFLRTHKASLTAENYHQDFKNIAEFAVSLDPDWFGTLPATFLYGRRGRLRQVYKGALSYRELERAVIPLLEESGKP